MSNNLTTTRQRNAVLPSVVLIVLAVAFLLASGARAEDPPIVSVGPVTASDNTASGDVDSEGKANACVNDEHSQADPSESETGSMLNLNQGSCQASSGSSADTGTQTGGESSAGSGSKKPTSTRGTSGATRSGAASTASVAAGDAVGLKIARVRSSTKGVSTTKHFRVLVTLKDLKGRLVRDAIVSIGKAPGAVNTVSGTCSSFSNRLGQANVVVHVDQQSLGKRLFLKISARTPKARAIALRSVRLPATG
jgi:hypothetical protein